MIGYTNNCFITKNYFSLFEKLRNKSTDPINIIIANVEIELELERDKRKYSYHWFLRLPNSLNESNSEAIDKMESEG